MSMPNFVNISQLVVKISKFSMFQDGGHHHLDCRIRKILMAVGVWKAQTHHCTKFCQNRLFRCRDIATFRIFKMATAIILDFRNRKILFGIGVKRIETHQHAKFGQISQSVAKI